LREREEEAPQVRTILERDALAPRWLEPRAVFRDDERVVRLFVARDRTEPRSLRERALEATAHESEILVVVRRAQRIERFAGLRAMRERTRGVACALRG